MGDEDLEPYAENVVRASKLYKKGEYADAASM